MLQVADQAPPANASYSESLCCRLAIEQVAQNRVREMVDEQRREIHPAVAKQVETGGLERFAGEEPVAKAQHHAIIVAQTRIGERHQPRLADALARVGEERVVQRHLGPAGLRARQHFRAKEIGPQEIVGHGETPLPSRASR